jgi:hypothetical protein
MLTKLIKELQEVNDFSKLAIVVKKLKYREL